MASDGLPEGGVLLRREVEGAGRWLNSEETSGPVN